MLFFTVPFFKHADYLKETLSSLIQQSDPAWRATIFDNSVDPIETAACEQVVKSFHDQRLLYKKNVSHLDMASNWNQGLDQCGDALGVCILHSDDRLLPDYASVMRKALQQFPEVSAFFCKTSIIDEVGKPIFSFADWYKTLLVPKGDWVTLDGVLGVQKLIPGNFVFCPTICFNTRKIQAYRFNPKMKMVVDFDLTLRFLLDGATFKGYYQKPLYEYRRHAQNLTSEMNKNMIRFREEYDLYLDLAKKLELKGELVLAMRARKGQIVKFNLMFQMFLLFVSGKWGRIPGYFQFLKNLE